MLLFAVLPLGCAVVESLESGAHIRAATLSPLIDRPARLTVLHSPTPLDWYGDTVSAVLVHFEGQGLALRTGTLRESPPYPGTLRGFLEGAAMPQSFRLYEARGKDGRTLGYLLARDHGLSNFLLDEDESLIANAMPVKDSTP